MVKTKNKTVFVALSGGVDSAVAAALLKNEGYHVVGVFMKNWADPAWPCPWQEDRLDAMKVTAHLNIPFKTFDFTKEYKAKVVDYMVAEYAAGRTPNPDVVCNKEIKFGIFLKEALARGADFIATGHYIRLAARDKQQGTSKDSISHVACRMSLMRARDKNKDQSYFLWTLTQQQLKHCLFPIGEIESKAKVRQLARDFGLPTADKKDSQGICFMGPVDIKEFLRPRVEAVPGPVVTTSGRRVGRHDGLAFFTIGQRKGVGVGGTGPYYVAEKKYETNTLVVAPLALEEKLCSRGLVAEGVSFIDKEPNRAIQVQASIRYRQQPVAAKLSPQKSGFWKVEFKEPMRAVTEGQSVVFYQGDSFDPTQRTEMIGGGIIKERF